jgi:hypothetical protein
MIRRRETANSSAVNEKPDISQDRLRKGIQRRPNDKAAWMLNWLDPADLLSVLLDGLFELLL